jgi:hypothetical protein
METSDRVYLASKKAVARPFELFGGENIDRVCPKTLLFLTLFLLSQVAQAAPADDPWSAYRFLLGEWVGEGSGQPGQGTGEFSFTLDLQGKLLVRRNRVEYPARAARPASSHEDLMVIYRGAEGKRTRAIYFDNEDHIIHYTVTFSDDKQALTFLSDTMPSEPRFRLSYARGKSETVSVKFEVAPPGKPDGFKTYVEGTARRKERPKCEPEEDE